MKYRKKPVVIDAFQWNGTHIGEANAFIECAFSIGSDFADPVGVQSLYIETLEGEMRAAPGDWIIKGVKGEFYPCKPDIFEATYEVAE